ncbi:MAG: glucan biosynthesis protein D [Rhizobiales bacterium]|nr:glucan biosynthesis protein D [Hyphomicrobiales bacterium]
MVGAVSLPWLVALARVAAVAAPSDTGAGSSFDETMVRGLARELAQKPYRGPDDTLPDTLKDLSYDRYRTIRFRPDKSLWRGDKLQFEAQFFHRGFLFTNRVDIFQVVDGRAHRTPYSPSQFSFEGDVPPPDTDVGFAGFRLHGPINRRDYYDEITVFLGASYFRAVAKGQIYGLSARGLSIKTAEASGEEFPAFRSFWIERPKRRQNFVVVHALLDSESASAAYRFTIRGGPTTVHDVEMMLFPRVDLAQAGIATLTSMFFFAANDRGRIDDFRPAVHDSDGLEIRTGSGEQLWRPLANPQDLQVSSFADTNPRGFGLMQRQRDFRSYQDLEANYEKRPSAWIEPIGEWGDGEVRLVEIPTKSEIHDNIVVFWRPHEPLRAKDEHRFSYRIHWGYGVPKPGPLATFTATRVGAGSENRRLFVLDAAGPALKSLKASDSVRGEVSADKGKIEHVVTQPNPHTGGWRLSFELATEKAPAIELRAQFLRDDKPLSEVWTYRWTP